MPSANAGSHITLTHAERQDLERARGEAKAVRLSPESSPPDQTSAKEFSLRILIVLAAAQGRSVCLIAERMGCSKSLVSGVVRMYAAGRSPAALRPRRRGRKPAPAKTTEARAILARLWAEFGAAISPAQYLERLNRELSSPVKLPTVRRHLRDLGARLRKSG